MANLVPQDGSEPTPFEGPEKKPQVGETERSNMATDQSRDIALKSNEGMKNKPREEPGSSTSMKKTSKEDPEPSGSTKPEPEPNPSAPKPEDPRRALPRLQTHVEVLWRTLIANC
jgi:hypothetical protein